MTNNDKIETSKLWKRHRKSETADDEVFKRSVRDHPRFRYSSIWVDLGTCPSLRSSVFLEQNCMRLESDSVTITCGTVLEGKMDYRSNGTIQPDQLFSYSPMRACQTGCTIRPVTNMVAHKVFMCRVEPGDQIINRPNLRYYVGKYNITTAAFDVFDKSQSYRVTVWLVPVVDG